jgi:hypothetical protein
LYFSFTSLSIVLGLFLQPLHSGLFIFLYRHLYRLTPWVSRRYGAGEEPLLTQNLAGAARIPYAAKQRSASPSC